MNKKLIALAIAGALAAPLAANAGDDTVLYGRAKMNLTNNNNGTPDTDTKVSGDNRIGIKGAEDLGNGMQGVYKLEFAIGGETGTSTLGYREQSVGIAGDFGKVLIGNLSAPYYDGAIGPVDISNIFEFARQDQGNGGRIGQAIGYWNSFGAVNFGVTYGTNTGGVNQDNDIEANVNFDAGPVAIGIGIQDTGVSGSDTITGLTAIYGQDNWSAGLQYTDATESAWMLQGQVSSGANNFFLQYGDAPDPSDASPWVIGVQHNLSKRTRVYAEAGDRDTTADSEFGVGVRHDF